MKLTSDQLSAIANHIAESAEPLTVLIANAIAKHAQYDRAATVSQQITVSRDKDDYGLIHVSCKIKVKQPTHKFRDETSWNEGETVVSVRLGEEAGQQRLGE